MLKKIFLNNWDEWEEIKILIKYNKRRDKNIEEI
jgi:hypothetical protein